MSDLRRFEGRVAIVTGAASGAGKATARRLASEGASVTLGDINASACEEAAEEIVATGGAALAVHCDVRSEEAIAGMVARTAEMFGRIDVLHNNAADLSAETLGRDQMITDMDVEVWDRALAADLRGPMLGCKHAIPVMLRTGGGAIVNTTSTAGLIGDVRQTAYGAAKAGLIMLTKNVATMYGKAGVRCNAIAPGLMMSPAADFLDEAGKLDYWCERLTDQPGQPEEMAGLVAYLASDEARYVTGQVIAFDGGTTAHRPSYTLNAWRQAKGISR